MITPTIFYAQMKKWVSSDAARPKLQHIYFDGERAFATNVASMALVKNYPVQVAHYETPDGECRSDIPNDKPLDYDRVLIGKEQQGWRKDLGFNGYAQSVGFLAGWKNAIGALSKIAKMKGETPVIMLQKHGKRLYAYASNEFVSMKVLLLDNMEGAETLNDWEAGFNVRYIENIVDFLKATEPLSLAIYTNKRQFPILTIETDELLLLVSSVNIDREKSKYWRLLNWVDSERPPVLEIIENNDDVDMDGILG